MTQKAGISLADDGLAVNARTDPEHAEAARRWILRELADDPMRDELLDMLGIGAS